MNRISIMCLGVKNMTEFIRFFKGKLGGCYERN